LLILALSVVSTGCGDREPASTTAAGLSTTENADETPPDQRLYDAVITDTRDDEVRWILHSERLDRFADRDEAQLYTVRMQFFRADTLFSTLTSRRGRADLKTKNLHVWGDVVVVTTDGRRLETTELTYDNRRGLIYNDVYDRFTRGDDVLTGWGMEASPDLSYFELKREVAAEVAPDDTTGSDQ